MARPRSQAAITFFGGTLAAVLSQPCLAQGPLNGRTAGVPASSQVAVVRPDLVVLQALLQNPVTAPYRIATSMRGRQVALSGRVGTKVVHDTAVQVAIATGYSIRDDLTIDTGEANRLAAYYAAGPNSAPGMGMGASYLAPSLGISPYVYPPPLFGRLDDPFFGFEPPLVSYPPWWRAVNQREPINLSGMANPGANAPMANAAGAANPAGNPYAVASPTAPQDGKVEMTLDPQGVATLRGTVPTLADRVAVGQQIAQTPGITQVINELSVAQPAGNNNNNVAPPPPPQPMGMPAARPPVAPAPVPEVRDAAPAQPVAIDRGDLEGRVAQGLARRPALAGLPIKVSVREGVAYLSGKVPTVYEAMMAFRAAQQMPGVRDVDDRLEFTVPDEEKRNPLQVKGRPEDVEAYMTAQIRRQIGDLAHVDRVQLLGNTLEVRGTLTRDEDRPRLEAILRSMPILRGFQLAPLFVPE